MAQRRDRLALDRSSVRMVDPDSGHLHVAISNISKANVCDYAGYEIADGERLGLDQRRVYKLLRDPAELAKAARTFEGKPLLMSHRPQLAGDHDHAITVGAVHNVRWSPPHLKASLSVWDGAAIAAIRDGSRAALSCGYNYDADMRPGTYEGERYDGRMTNLRGNHVSLVEEGRAGPDVMVGDAAIRKDRKMPDVDPAVVAECLGDLVDYLRSGAGDDPGLEAIAAKLKGGSDPDSGTPTAAMGRIRRHAADAKVEESRAIRFPNRNRLVL